MPDRLTQIDEMLKTHQLNDTMEFGKAERRDEILGSKLDHLEEKLDQHAEHASQTAIKVAVIEEKVSAIDKKITYASWVLGMIFIGVAVAYFTHV